eukprot:1136465-Pelagomonas_calceolata.AAC.2
MKLCGTMHVDRAAYACSSSLFAILDMTATISIRSGPPIINFESEGWTGLVRHVCMHCVEYGMPTLRSFQLAPGTAVSRSSSQAHLKLEVVCFNFRADSLLPLSYVGGSLPYTDSFKYLGMACDKRFNLSTAAEAALKSCIAGTYRVKTFANDYNLTNRLHAFIWLLKSHAIPSGMYASQVWATPYGREQKWTIRCRGGF